jgi:hypothetical protein
MREHGVTLRGYSIHLLCNGHLVLSSPPATAPTPATASTHSRTRAIPVSVGQRRLRLLEGVEKDLRGFQIGRLEPFGKPVVERLDERQGLPGTALVA